MDKGERTQNILIRKQEIQLQSNNVEYFYLILCYVSFALLLHRPSLFLLGNRWRCSWQDSLMDYGQDMF